MAWPAYNNDRWQSNSLWRMAKHIGVICAAHRVTQTWRLQRDVNRHGVSIWRRQAAAAAAA